MSIILGIDTGGSTTKIVGYHHSGKLISALQVKANDALTSVYGALGKYVDMNHLCLNTIDHILLTGVGASRFTKDIYNIPTTRLEEFEAIGIGGLALSGKKEAIVVSMGTGTAYVRATAEKITHIGGSGVGGGTIVGLFRKIVNASDFETIMQMASSGDLSNTDLLIRDISTDEIVTLPPNATASNFGKLKDNASDADIALGILNMTFQTIGTLAVFACKNDSIKDVVLTGTLTTFPQAEQIFSEMQKLYKLQFIIPENAIFATAVGAALSYFKRIPARLEMSPKS